MPTGYTHDIYDGKDTSFDGYVWRCARAFGALVTMRDDGMDAAIPEELEPSDYHAKAIEKDEEELRKLSILSAEALADLEDGERRRHEESQKKNQQEVALREQRYSSVLAEVNAWTPPSPDHKRLKEFMRQQLEESMKFDCSTWDSPYKPKTREERLQKIRESIQYHQKNYEEELERCAGRNKWLRELRESVPVPRRKKVKA